jgi:hypothetical protein
MPNQKRSDCTFCATKRRITGQRGLRYNLSATRTAIRVVSGNGCVQASRPLTDLSECPGSFLHSSPGIRFFGSQANAADFTLRLPAVMLVTETKQNR